VDIGHRILKTRQQMQKFVYVRAARHVRKAGDPLEKGPPMTRFLPSLALCLVLGAALAQPARANDAVADAISEYLMFADYGTGVILPEQIDQMVFDQALFIDTRNPASHAERSIPGSIHIEWREILDHLDDIPRDRMTILYCDSGILSAQAGFALRLLGYSNVLFLQGGVEGFFANAAYRP
jgi:rhodanese-related sulfurtransferase